MDFSIISNQGNIQTLLGWQETLSCTASHAVTGPQFFLVSSKGQSHVVASYYEFMMEWVGLTGAANDHLQIIDFVFFNSKNPLYL
jgi:hypothetical protein